MLDITIFPLCRLALAWIAGICLAYHYCISIKILLLWLAISILHYSFVYNYTSIKQLQTLWTSIMALMAICLMSYSHICLHIEHQKKLSRWTRHLMPLQAYCVCIEKVYQTNPIDTIVQL